MYISFYENYDLIYTCTSCFRWLETEKSQKHCCDKDRSLYTISLAVFYFPFLILRRSKSQGLDIRQLVAEMHRLLCFVFFFPRDSYLYFLSMTAIPLTQQKCKVILKVESCVIQLTLMLLVPLLKNFNIILTLDSVFSQSIFLSREKETSSKDSILFIKPVSSSKCKTVGGGEWVTRFRSMSGTKKCSKAIC